MGKHSLKPYAILFIGVFFVSFSSLFCRLAEAPPLAIAFYRMLFSLILLAPVVLPKCYHEFRSIKRSNLLIALVSGVFLAFHFYTWVTSLFYTTVAASTVLVTTHPLFVAIGSYLLFKEKINAKSLLAGAVVIFGTTLIAWGDFHTGRKALLGDILALTSALLMTGYLLIGRSFRQRHSLFAYILIVYGCSAVTLLLIALVAGVPFYPFPATTWLLFAGLALFPTIGGHTLINWTLAYLPAPVVSVSILGEPVGASILALLFLGEVMSLEQLVSGIIILLGLFWFIKNSWN